MKTIQVLFFLLVSLVQKSNAQTFLFTGQNGEVEGAYKVGATQIFQIKVSSGAKVFINWSRIGLDGRMPECYDNYIEVVTGGCAVPVFTLTRFCQKSGEELPNDIYSMDNCITIKLYTQLNNYMNNSQIGFKLTYAEVPSSLSSTCLKEISNHIMHTPNWPQSYNLGSSSCSKEIIRIPDKKAMQLFLMGVDTDESQSSQKCVGGLSDTLYIQSSWNCVIHHTRWNNDGDGHTAYLDRHYVNCPQDQVISEFQLQRNKANQYRYSFKCCPVRGTCVYIQKKTATKTRSNADNPVNLKDHNVDCGSNAYLSSFKLWTDMKRLHYEYSCCRFSNAPVTCQEISTKETTASAKAYDLDKQPVTCSGSLIGLQSFQLKTRSAKKALTKWFYKYKCCSHSAPTQRTLVYCGQYLYTPIVEFGKGTEEVSVEFVKQSLANHNKSGILLGYTIYDAAPSFHYGDQMYLIPFKHGNYYIGEYTRTAEDSNKNFKELHMYTGPHWNSQQFQIVPGLSGCKGCVSFRSVSHPYEYIFAQNDEALYASEENALKGGVVDFEMYASFYVRADKFHAEYLAIEMAYRTDFYLVVEDSRLHVRQRMESNINDEASFRLDETAPVEAKVPKPAEEPSKLWIIGICIVALLVTSNFVKHFMVKRHNEAIRKSNQYHKKLLNDAASGNTQTTDHPAAQTNSASNA